MSQNLDLFGSQDRSSIDDFLGEYAGRPRIVLKTGEQLNDRELGRAVHDWVIPRRERFVEGLREIRPSIDEPSISQVENNDNFPYGLATEFPDLTLEQKMHAYDFSVHEHGFIRSLMERQGFDELAANLFAVAVDEATTNAYKWGNDRDISKIINLKTIYRWGNNRHGIVAVITDQSETPIKQEMIKLNLMDKDNPSKPEIRIHNWGSGLMYAASSNIIIFPAINIGNWKRGNTILLDLYADKPRKDYKPEEIARAYVENRTT